MSHKLHYTVQGFCRFISSPVSLIVGLLLVLVANGMADEKVDRAELPKLADMPIPTAEELFAADENDKEFDWIVLPASAPEDRTVIVVNPIFPRPDTLKKMAEEYKKLETSKPQNQKEREDRVKRMKELQRLVVTLVGDQLTEYSLPMSAIDHILLFEDLILLRVDELIKEGDIRKAYELLLNVEREIPNWEKSVPRFEQLLLAESTIRANEGDAYAALALLDEAAARNLQNPELRPRFGQIVGPMIQDAMDKEDFRKVRYLIARIEKVVPDHELIPQSKNRLQQLVASLLETSDKHYQQRDFPAAAKLAWKASTVLPLQGNEKAAFSRIVARHQVLRVGVEDSDNDKQIFPVPQESRERLTELVEVPLFEPSSADELTYFRSSYFEIWDPADLGREVVFSLRETRPHWQSQPVLTANIVAEALGHRIDESSPYFSSRLASFVKEISVRSPTQLRIRFSRVPLNIESLLRFPVTGLPQRDPAETPEASGTETAQVSAAKPAEGETISETPELPAVLSTRFRKASSDETGRVFLRNTPEPDGLDGSQYHIAEVQEVHFADRDKMLQSMIRGELDYLPHLLPWEVNAFKASGEFVTKQYSIPLTHVIAFNPMSDRIVNAQMRRALSFAVNREGILKSIVLKDDAMQHGRPTSAAWHLESYATEPNEVPPAYNLRLAYALRFAAERQLQLAELTKLTDAAKSEARKKKENFDPEKFRAETKVDYVKLPRLRFVVEPEPTCIAAAERILLYWQKIGFEVDLIKGDQPGDPLTDGEWDMCYRRVRMEEPLLELWPLLANDNSLDMNRLGMFPDWMRQELINLDYASSFQDAQTRLFTIHNHISAEAFLIPLWEVDDFAVWRKPIIGMPERPLSTYQNVERWIVRP
jgi:ABC-type transport system substrate-binding protein